MLVLTRRRGQRLILNGNITIEVIRIDDDKVRLGIIAPPEVGIWREEIWDKRQLAETVWGKVPVGEGP